MTVIEDRHICFLHNHGNILVITFMITLRMKISYKSKTCLHPLQLSEALNIQSQEQWCPLAVSQGAEAGGLLELMDLRSAWATQGDSTSKQIN